MKENDHKEFLLDADSLDDTSFDRISEHQAAGSTHWYGSNIYRSYSVSKSDWRMARYALGVLFCRVFSGIRYLNSSGFLAAIIAPRLACELLDPLGNITANCTFPSRRLF